MSPHIESIDSRVALEETLEALHELNLIWDEETLPGDPPTPKAQRLVDWRNPLDFEVLHQWVMWKGPEIIGTSGMWLDRVQNLENGFGWVYVHPQHRGIGHGRALATPMLDVAETEGRTRFAFGIKDGRPEEALAIKAGLKSAYREQVSRLDFQSVDWSLMESWMARAAERASDYELLFMKSPIDEEHLQAFCDLMYVMNSAPREGYVEDAEVMTPEMWRDIESKMTTRGREILIYIARHAPTGAFAGFTNVAYKHLQPDHVEQWDTGVDPAHRNLGLGRWVKAAMAFKLRDEYPGVRRIDTENAGSNAPMLSINIEMGFKPILVQNVWQGDLATLRKNLSV
jgi:GNAT superfamily N-acetyltransferase